MSEPTDYVSLDEAAAVLGDMDDVRELMSRGLIEWAQRPFGIVIRRDSIDAYFEELSDSLPDFEQSGRIARDAMEDDV